MTALKLTALALSAAVLTATAGAQTYGDCILTGKKGSSPIKPAVAGQLSIQTNLPAPGWFNGDTPSSIKSGFEYCLAANIAYRAGLDKLRVQNVAFDALVAGKTSKNYDMAFSQVTITPERAKVVDFSVPYFSSDQGVLVKKGAKVTAASIKGLRLGVQQATTAQDYLKNSVKPTKPVKVFPDTPSLFTALRAGQIDAAILDTAIVLAQANASGGQFEVVGQYKTGEQYGAIYPKGSANKASIDKIIKAMGQDGSLKKLSQAYLSKAFGGDPTSVPYFK